MSTLQPRNFSSSSAPSSVSDQSISKPTSSSKRITIAPTVVNKPTGYEPNHHVGSPPTSFTNPWPSSPPSHSLASILKARFFNRTEKNFVPIPTDKSLLAQVVEPDWGARDPNAWRKLKATWLGHAGFLVEFPSLAPNRRGVRVLLDPVFSDRMSPFTFLGPLRFTPPPCKIEDLPDVDFVCISHNHYDHLDTATIKYVRERKPGNVRFLCALGVAANIEGMGVPREEIVEMDWWNGVGMSVEENGVPLGQVRAVCTPCQHISGRWINDHSKTLWCSFVLEEVPHHSTEKSSQGATTTDANRAESSVSMGKKLFFAGDTAYRAVPRDVTEEDLGKLPVCPAFGQIGKSFGPFDLALLPIGCYSPRWWMSSVHCAPEDSICIHKDVGSRKSIGMHYGTIRGGISQYYEDVTEPPKRWKKSCEEAGLQWQTDVGLVDIGGTVLT